MQAVLIYHSDKQPCTRWDLISRVACTFVHTLVRMPYVRTLDPPARVCGLQVHVLTSRENIIVLCNHTPDIVGNTRHSMTSFLSDVTSADVTVDTIRQCGSTRWVDSKSSYRYDLGLCVCRGFYHSTSFGHTRYDTIHALNSWRNGQLSLAHDLVPRLWLVLYICFSKR